MSLETWKQAHYPAPAAEVDKSDAVQHSLMKWQGLRPEALAEHGVEPTDSGIRDEDDNFLEIDASTCALCWRYYDPALPEDADAPEDHACGECPLYRARGNHSCAGGDQTEDERAALRGTPFFAWEGSCDPEPMIHWLKKAQAWEDANSPKPTVTVRVHAGPKPEDARITADEAIAMSEAIHQHVLNTSHAPPASTAKPPIGGLHHEGPANPSPREGD